MSLDPKRLFAKFRRPKSPAPPLASTPGPSVESPPPAPAPEPESIQTNLWNNAFDKLQKDEPDLIKVYENILSAKLGEQVQQTWKSRADQVQRLIEIGQAETQRGASLKEKVQAGLEPVNAIKGMIDGAVKASPEASVAWASICLGLQVLSNTVTESAANREGITYITSRIQWCTKLFELILDPNDKSTGSTALRMQFQENVIELYKKFLLYQINSVCLYNRKVLAGLFRDAIKFDDWEKQLVEIKAAEAAVRRDCKQFNSEETKSKLDGIYSTLHDFYQDLEKTSAQLITYQAKQTELLQKQVDWQEEQTRARTDQRFDDCLGYLCDLDSRVEKDRIEKTKGDLLEDLYCWVFENHDFKRWRNGDQDVRLLWVNADPGKGKTMLMCGIIGQMEMENTYLVSYFFCQATDPRLNNATAVLRGLIYLLLNQRPSLITPILQKYNRLESRFSKDNATFWELSRIFKDVLGDPELPTTILAIDALDECTTQCQDLLDLISDTSDISSVQWFVSSRNEPAIREGMTRTSKMIELQLELNHEAVSNAVNTYITLKVEKLAHDKRYSTELKEEIKTVLRDRAGDTFLWVALVYQQLAEVKLLRNTLSKLKQFPSGLQKLYQTMLDKISESECPELCEDMLAVVTTAYRPLALSELRVLTESPEEFDDLKVLITSCGSFLTLKDDVVYFVHQSAKQFLEKDWLWKSRSSLANYHQVLFSRSLNLLSKTLRRDIYELEERFGPGIFIDETPVLDHDHDPLLSCRYSCIHWVDHLCDSASAEELRCGDLLRDGSEVDFFIQTKYFHWLEALSLIRGVVEGVRAVRKLLRVVESSEGQKLSKLLWDAFNFFSSYRHIIETAPLQLYVSALLFSPSQSQIKGLFSHELPQWIRSSASVTDDWDTSVRRLEEHTSLVFSVAISDDGQSLEFSPSNNSLAIYTGSKIEIWDVRTGTPVQTLRSHQDDVVSMAFTFSRLNPLFASASGDGTIKIWNPSDGSCERTIICRPSDFRFLAFSPSASRPLLASCSPGQGIQIWNTVQGTLVQTLESRGQFPVLAFVPTDHEPFLAFSLSGGTLSIWDLTTYSCLREIDTHSKLVKSLSASVSGLLASSSSDGTIKIWDPRTGTQVRSFTSPTKTEFSSVALSQNGEIVIAGSSCESLVMIWDTTQATPPRKKSLIPRQLVSCGNNHVALLSRRSSTVDIWDAVEGTLLQDLSGHEDDVNAIAISHKTNKLASASKDRTVKIWDAPTGKPVCVHTLRGHTKAVKAVAFSGNGLQLASVSYDHTVMVWSIATGACTKKMQVTKTYVLGSMAFSNDGQHLAISTLDHCEIHGLEDDCHREPKTYRPEQLSRTMTFSRDDKYIACSSYSEITVWDVNSATRLFKLKHEVLEIFQLEFHENDSLLFTEHGMVKLPPLKVIEESITETVSAVTFSGYGLSKDRAWIMKDGVRLLWLPLDYRPASGESQTCIVQGSSIFIAPKSGAVYGMQFQWNE
ncbi:hypothetical protein FDECE_12524 [Fusarium decemcellulare]|nr:hypothetical protein FDECE_12524 [Fusarium decemcellulare]